MKLKQSIITLLIFALTLLAACSQAPKDVAKEYLDAVNHHEYEKAKKLGTPEIQEHLDRSSKITAIDNDKSKDRTYEVISEKVSGDISNVSYNINNKGVKNEFKGTMRLVKTDGKWLVAENDPGYKEYLQDQADKQLKYEIDQLKNQLEATKASLPSGLKEEKAKLLQSINELEIKLAKAVSPVEKITVKEDIRLYRYQVTKFLADAENM
jgi:hypothetical protein